LDEPTSGIAQREGEALGQLLLDFRERTGATLVIIEHDVPLISSIADRLICLHLGEVISEGPPHAVTEDPGVIEAYLGADPDAIARSGRRPRATRSPAQKTARSVSAPRRKSAANRTTQDGKASQDASPARARKRTPAAKGENS
ncbi:MAG TPA: hypothetical protein VFV02_02235, partial [Acidimicrobiales bacterium]|nr:hypothetical protein [Acidimicrobiales bacterium]